MAAFAIAPSQYVLCLFFFLLHFFLSYGKRCAKPKGWQSLCCLHLPVNNLSKFFLPENHLPIERLKQDQRFLFSLLFQYILSGSFYRRTCHTSEYVHRR